jgi:hypothetical protein
MEELLTGATMRQRTVRAVVAAGLVAAVAAFAAQGATAAAPVPAFGSCIKVAKGTGTFTNSGCTVKAAGGSFEWFGGGPETFFEEKIVTATIGEVQSGQSVDCSGQTAFGVLYGERFAEAEMAFTGCTLGGVPCQSSGAAGGEVRTSFLEGEFGVIKAGETPVKDKIGLVLHNFAGENAPFAQFECAGFKLNVIGGVIVPVIANKMLQVETLKYVAKKGLQKPAHFEGGVGLESLLVSFAGEPFEPAGIGLTTTLTLQHKVEVNSVL